MSAPARARPCCLCECPVLDVGVPLSHLNKEKLSEWLAKKQMHQFDADRLRIDSICQLCVDRARDEFEVNEETAKFDWWSDFEMGLFDEPMYAAIPEVISEVKIKKEDPPPVIPKVITELLPDPPTVKSKTELWELCVDCCKVFLNNKALLKHRARVHGERLVTKPPEQPKKRACLEVKASNLVPTPDPILEVMSRDEIERRFLCVYCNLRFKTNEEVSSHVQEAHSKILTFACSDCAGAFFTSSRELKNHLKLFHGTKYKCVYCTRSKIKREPFQSRRALQEHVDAEHRDVAFVCKFNRTCEAYFRTYKEKMKHVKKVHQGSRNQISCLYCNKLLVRKTLRHHIDVHHAAEAIGCDFQPPCQNEFFLSEADRQSHRQQVHEKHGNLLTCIYCNATMAKTSLTIHVKTKHATVAIKCNHHANCRTYFHTEKDRQEHIQQEHLTGKVLEPKTCQFCGTKVQSSSGLYHHIKYKHQQYPFKCMHRGCYQFFSSEANREEHFSKEHGPQDKMRIFKCEHCHYRSARKTALTHHIETCHGSEQIKCHVCHKILPSKTALQYHFDACHKYQRSCTHCGKVVKQMVVHLKRRVCPYCGVASQCSVLNRTHVQKCYVVSVLKPKYQAEREAYLEKLAQVENATSVNLNVPSNGSK